jgi:hypothetical protein
VTETVPDNYVAEDGTTPGGTYAKSGISVGVVSTCGDGNEVPVSFVNTPLTDITVSVDSLVPGGTESTITCVDSNGVTVASGITDADAVGEGDGSVTAEDLVPGTYTCTIVVDP